MSEKEKKERSAAFLRKRKLMLVMPLLVMPFVTFAFWALGGGQGAVVEKHAKAQGFNTALPSAENASDSTFDKLAFYKKAESDSIERLKRMKDDPYYQSGPAELYPSSTGNGMQQGYYSGFSGHPTPNGSYNGYGYNDPNERRVSEKLAQLNAALNSPGGPSAGYAQQPSMAAGQNPSVTSADIDRLEKMMQAMQTSPAGEVDPEMQQINNVLGQILDIQHPERVSERLQQNSIKHKGMVFPVTAVQNYDPVSLLAPNKAAGKDTGKIKENMFFSLTEQQAPESANAIAAAIHETQTLVNGSIVKLRLLNDIYVSGQLLPKDNFVFGVAQISGERLLISINSLRYGNAIFPVQLSIYDIDGLNGIHIPGAISRDVAKESGDRAIQSLGMTSLDPSMTAQAMGAGIEAVKSLMSKKVKLVKVTVKAGYQVLLRDDNQKNEQ